MYFQTLHVLCTNVIANGGQIEAKKKMGLADIKKELNRLDKAKLIDLLADLYKKNKSVKEFFDYYINPDERKLLTKYREKVFEAFYPRSGDSYKLKDGKQAIRDFKKLGASAESVVDLMLFYVETGVKFTNEFGDINEAFYNSVASVYYGALTLMKKEVLLDKFAERAKDVVTDTSGIGWGFHDYLMDCHCDFYQDLENRRK